MNNELEKLKNELDAFITINDACEILKCSRSTIYRLAEAGKITLTKVSLRKSLVSLESIRNYVKEIKGE